MTKQNSTFAVILLLLDLFIYDGLTFILTFNQPLHYREAALLISSILVLSLFRAYPWAETDEKRKFRSILRLSFWGFTTVSFIALLPSLFRLFIERGLLGLLVTPFIAAGFSLVIGAAITLILFWLSLVKAKLIFGVPCSESMWHKYSKTRILSFFFNVLTLTVLTAGLIGLLNYGLFFSYLYGATIYTYDQTYLYLASFIISIILTLSLSLLSQHHKLILLVSTLVFSIIGAGLSLLIALFYFGSFVITDSWMVNLSQQFLMLCSMYALWLPFAVLLGLIQFWVLKPHAPKVSG